MIRAQQINESRPYNAFMSMTFDELEQQARTLSPRVHTWPLALPQPRRSNISVSDAPKKNSTHLGEDCKLLKWQNLLAPVKLLSQAGVGVC